MFILNRPVHTKEFLDLTGVPHSTWSDALLLFLRSGLVVRNLSRENSDGRVKTFALFSLSQKGKLVARSLYTIAQILSGNGEYNYATEVEVNRQKVVRDLGELDERIIRCIEKGLESFGAQAKNSVQIYLALRYNVRWNEVPRRMREFSDCLQDRFGPKGAATIEAVIYQELRLRTLKDELVEGELHDAGLLDYVSKLRSSVSGVL
jgi:hypothetical protein